MPVFRHIQWTICCDECFDIWDYKNVDDSRAKTLAKIKKDSKWVINKKVVLCVECQNKQVQNGE